MQTSPQTFSHYPAWPAPVEAPLQLAPDHSCMYLPGKTSRVRAILAHRIPPALYHQFMDAGFRRSGFLIYQPACPGCRSCEPIRIPVDQFKPSKSQRRCWRRNQDLRVTIGAPVVSDEKYDLYRRYLHDWHGRCDGDSWEDFEAFLYDSPVKTIEFTYRDTAGTLLAVGICDLCALSLSSVYHFFDPDHARRGIGTYGVLREIEFARSRAVPYYYLGYWVYGCKSMTYKADFTPHQILDTDGIWRKRIQNRDMRRVLQ